MLSNFGYLEGPQEYMERNKRSQGRLPSVIYKDPGCFEKILITCGRDITRRYCFTTHEKDIQDIHKKAGQGMMLAELSRSKT